MRARRVGAVALTGVLSLGVLDNIGVRSAGASSTSKSAVCFQALIDVHNRLAPIVEAANRQVSLRVGPWDPAGSELTVGDTYDAEVLTVADDVIEMHLNCATTRPVSRRQMRPAFRFLVLHEYTHILQRTFGEPDFDPDGEHMADCAAVLMMWSWDWPMPAGALDGSHGGCPAEMYGPTYDWLVAHGVAL